MKFILFIIMFFMIGALLIVSNNDLAFYDDENLNKFVEFYGLWINQLYSNFQNLTGNVVRLDWFPESNI